MNRNTMGGLYAVLVGVTIWCCCGSAVTGSGLGSLSSADSGAYDAGPPAFLFLGNSETDPTHVNSYGAYTDAATRHWSPQSPLINMGLGGLRANEVEINDPTIRSGGPCNDAGYGIPGMQECYRELQDAAPGHAYVVSWWMGTNDLGICPNAGVPPCTAAALESSTIAVLLAARGMTPTPWIVCATLVQRGWTGLSDAGSFSDGGGPTYYQLWQTNAALFNTWVRAQTTTVYDSGLPLCDEIWDIGADPILGDAQAPFDTTYYYDQIHPNFNTDIVIIAPYLVDAAVTALEAPP